MLSRSVADRQLYQHVQTVEFQLVARSTTQSSDSLNTQDQGLHLFSQPAQWLLSIFSQIFVFNLVFPRVYKASEIKLGPDTS